MKPDLDATLPESESMDLGARVRTLRELYGFSQRELARRAGITNAMISMIEQNRVSPSIASLKKVLSGFPLSLSEFFSDGSPTPERIFYRSADLMRLASGHGITLLQVGVQREGRKLQVLHETYEPGGDTGDAMLGHEGEEAGVVVRGSIEITVGGRTETLGPGDGYHFHSRLPHRFRNRGTDPCEIVSACTPPSF